MVQINECYAYFALVGSFDPVAITERVGVNPTRSTREGDPIPKTKLRRKCCRWELHSRLPKTEPLESHVTDVLDQLDTREDTFREISQQFGGVMELVGYFYDFYPGLVLEQRTVERLAKYGITVDFDFYGWGQQEDMPAHEQTEG